LRRVFDLTLIISRRAGKRVSMHCRLTVSAPQVAYTPESATLILERLAETAPLSLFPLPCVVEYISDAQEIMRSSWLTHDSSLAYCNLSRKP